MKEREIFRESTGTEVWDNVKDVFGQSKNYIKRGLTLSQNVVEDILNRRYGRVAVLGRPSTGKSVLARQLKEKLIQEGMDKNKITMTLYDEILYKTIQEVGKSDKYWVDDEREILKHNIQNALMTTASNSIQLVELVPLGERDRGQSALESLPEDEKDNTYCLWVIANPNIQIKGGLLRTAILATKNNQVEDVLTAWNPPIRIVGWDPLLSKRVKGERVKRTLKKMAMPKDIHAINIESVREVEDLIASNPMESFFLNFLEQVADPQLRDEYKEALAQAFKFIASSGFRNVSVVYNSQIYESPITWYADMFK